MRAINLLVCAALLLTVLLGCGSGNQMGSFPQPPVPVAGKIFVANGSSNTILRFGMGDNGNVNPGARITSTALHAPIALLSDTANDRLYVFSLADADILVFNNVSTRNGSTVPDRLIAGAATTLPLLTGSISVALDNSRDLLYVTSTNILVFAPASSVTGNVPPLRVISTAFTPRAIALDPANDRMFVTDPVNNAIAIFDHASALNGAVVPDRVISGTSTQLASPGVLALDNSGRLIVCGTFGQRNLLVFPNAAIANGNIGPAASALLPSSAFQTAISPTGELYVADGNPSVSVYSNIATASGLLTPVRTIVGPNTGLDPFTLAIPPFVFGIAIDPTR